MGSRRIEDIAFEGRALLLCRQLQVRAMAVDAVSIALGGEPLAAGV